MTTEIKAALCYGSENWIINKRDAQERSCTNDIPETIIRPYKIGPPEKS
jgi:hypothetical protein